MFFQIVTHLQKIFYLLKKIYVQVNQHSSNLCYSRANCNLILKLYLEYRYDYFSHYTHGKLKQK